MSCRSSHLVDPVLKHDDLLPLDSYCGFNFVHSLKIIETLLLMLEHSPSWNCRLCILEWLKIRWGHQVDQFHDRPSRTDQQKRMVRQYRIYFRKRIINVSFYKRMQWKAPYFTSDPCPLEHQRTLLLSYTFSMEEFWGSVSKSITALEAGKVPSQFSGLLPIYFYNPAKIFWRWSSFSVCETSLPGYIWYSKHYFSEEISFVLITGVAWSPLLLKNVSLIRIICFTSSRVLTKMLTSPMIHSEKSVLLQ